MLFFVLFQLLRSGDRTLEWVRTVLPLEPAVQDELFEGTHLLLHNSLVGTVAVAGAQAVLLGAVFLVLGLGNVVFWIVTTFIAAMVPLVGASIVWAPASVSLFLVGRPVPAVVSSRAATPALWSTSSAATVVRPLDAESPSSLPSYARLEVST